MFKTDILFTGYYGQKNIGDDAFIEVAEWGAQKVWNKNNNRFLAIDKNLPKTTLQSCGYPLSIRSSLGLQNEFLINRTEHLVSAGGSTLHSALHVTNPKMIALRRKLNKGKIKIGGIGVSIGPFNTLKDENAVKNYLKNIDFLAVRDNASFELVSSLNLPYKPINAFDLAALLPDIYNFKNKDKIFNKKKTIGVSVCPFESISNHQNIKNENKRNRNTIELLKKIDAMEDVHFKFYIINGHPKVGDYTLTLETINKVAPRSYELIEYSKDTQTIWKSIANCDFVLSTRLHAAIFACFSNTAFMLNEYHRKCGDFLDNVAYDKTYRLYDSEYDVGNKANQIIDILNNRNEYLEPKRISEMKNLATFNFTKISL